MRVFIVGMDGYLGWTLTIYLLSRGYKVGGCDSYLRRRWVEEVGSQSVTPILSMEKRLEACEEEFGITPKWYYGDLRNFDFVQYALLTFNPDAIVHLGEMPSAPYSMIDSEHAVFTQVNNITGTLNLLFAMRDICPQAHLVKLGTMGEYGTPNIDIPEGFFEVTFRDRKDVLPFPKQPGSFYHCSKVHDSINIQLACNIWGLRSTDIMQGVVYGVSIPEMNSNERLLTRFDVDEAFGTIINRFCAQAVCGIPLTIYGKGNQTRGFLPIQDSMKCFQIAIDNPPKEGEYRVFNQFEDSYSINWLADLVEEVGDKLGLKVEKAHYENPRVEAEEHYYNPDRNHLPALGYKPTAKPAEVIEDILTRISKFKTRIVKDKIVPEIRWQGVKSKCSIIEVKNKESESNDGTKS